MWHQLASGTELDAAMRVLGGGAYVLKPASRAGSLGVTIFDSGVDSTAAWQRTHSAVTEAFASAWETTTARYLIEERLAGPEVSVECLIMDHQILFTNVTDKHVLPGAYPVEIGHQVPGPRAAAIQDDLIRCMKRVVDATGFAYGILHGEWILTDGGPALVECAARIPGDRIMELIELAYAVPFTHSYIQVLNGDQPKLPTSPVRGAAIRFLTPEPGAVQRITGQTDAGQIPGVYDVVVQAAEGGQLGPLRASYDRVGHVVATGETSVDAWATAERAARMIGIVTA
jgi:biotin carboxylase